MREFHKRRGVSFSFDSSDLERAAKHFYQRRLPTTQQFAAIAERRLVEIVRRGLGPAKSGRDHGTIKVCGVRVRYRLTGNQS